MFSAAPLPALRHLTLACLLIAALARLASAADPAPGALGVTLRDERGRVLIKDIRVGGPAEAAGLRPGDRVLSVNDQAVNSSAELIAALSKFAANDRVEIRASRDGWSKELPVTLGSRGTVASLPLSLPLETAPQIQTRTNLPRVNQPRVVPRAPLVNPDPFYRKRNERW